MHQNPRAQIRLKPPHRPPDKLAATKVQGERGLKPECASLPQVFQPSSKLEFLSGLDHLWLLYAASITAYR